MNLQGRKWCLSLIYTVVLINKNYNDNVIRHAMDPWDKYRQ
jgi:hypothetical protein